MERSAPDWYTQLSRRLGHTRSFAVTMRIVGWRVDRLLLRASRGRVDLSGPEIPTLLLTTRGRRSGNEYTVPLAYVRDGDNVVVACENLGLRHRTAWPDNALAQGMIVIELLGERQHRIARRPTEEELAR
ncbi:nitroreductase/quinone reductase family protein, partial [Actinomycetota bacterium]